MELKIYHVYNKSIAKFVIFNDEHEYSRMLQLINYYQFVNQYVKFSQYIRSQRRQNELRTNCFPSTKKQKYISIIAFCLMPTHIHLILMELLDNGVSNFMRIVLDSYTKYFNIKHKRKGPLWECNTKKRLVESDEQLLHLTRYIHLNPVTSYLVKTPEEWHASSYKEYIKSDSAMTSICTFTNVIDIHPIRYREFVTIGIQSQREMAFIKKLKD